METNHTKSLLDHMVKEEEITDVKCSLTFVGGGEGLAATSTWFKKQKT
jgi:hypothetical protein